MKPSTTHDAAILDQFTRQANPFADLAAHSSGSSLALIVQTADVNPMDDVLDVACGPGLLACALARVAHRVTGLDIVPAMLERAACEREAAGLTNLTFEPGDARALPHPAARFDLVITRFSFHHFEAPGVVLAELVRVCRPAGRVVVIDATPAADKRAAYDRLETLRDPSHTSALTPEELRALFATTGLSVAREVPFRLDVPLEAQIAASFPKPGDAARIREWVSEDAGTGADMHGIGAHMKEGETYLGYPCRIVVGCPRS